MTPTEPQTLAAKLAKHAPDTTRDLLVDLAGNQALAATTPELLEVCPQGTPFGHQDSRYYRSVTILVAALIDAQAPQATELFTLVIDAAATNSKSLDTQARVFAAWMKTGATNLDTIVTRLERRWPAWTDALGHVLRTQRSSPHLRALEPLILNKREFDLGAHPQWATEVLARHLGDNRRAWELFLTLTADNNATIWSNIETAKLLTENKPPVSL